MLNLLDLPADDLMEALAAHAHAGVMDVQAFQEAIIAIAKRGTCTVCVGYAGLGRVG